VSSTALQREAEMHGQEGLMQGLCVVTEDVGRAACIFRYLSAANDRWTANACTYDAVR
jgi:hypothetical protein